MSDIYSKKQKRVKVGFWFTAPEKTELDRIAQAEGLSLSQTGRAFVVEGMRRKLHEQQEDLQYAKLRQVLREERQASDDRMVHFLIQIANSVEQCRILITNVLEFALKLLIKGPNADDEITRTREDIVSRSSDSARRNVMNKHIVPVIAMFTAWKRGTAWSTGNGKERRP